MEAEDLSTRKPDPNPIFQNRNAQKPFPTPSSSPSSCRSSHHRRAHSELSFRIPNDLDHVSGSLDAPTASFDEIGSEDDLFCTYMNIENLGSTIDDGNATASTAIKSEGDLLIDGGRGSAEAGNGGDGEKSGNGKSRHRYSNSVDGSSMSRGEGVFGDDIIEAKKAMAPDKLAELWAIDPKRAKRILANRQSAARSKERKARYIIELERKVRTLQMETTILSAQLTLFQRDTNGLASENTELKLRLQAMEQQAQLRDALNEALKQEVERLKVATGETTPSDTYNLGMHHMPYTQPSFFLPQPQPGLVEPHSIQLSKLHRFQHKKSTQHHQPLLAGAHPNSFSEMLQQDPLGCFQGLDISNRGSHLVKSEGPSLSASESSSTF